MTITMTKTKCSACSALLATSNTNPDGLCGVCQRALKPGQARYAAWKLAGRPTLASMLKEYPARRINRRTKAQRLAEARVERAADKVAQTVAVEVAGNQVGMLGLPPVDRLPLDYLAAAVAEFQFRVGQAALVSALARKLKV